MMDDKTRDDLLKLFESKLNEAMRLYLETCTRCGVCTEACHVHASMGQVKYIAAYRAEIVRRLYKKYFKGRGKVWPSVGEARELSALALDELYEAAYSCTGCRRCMVYCPFGIDTQMLMSIAKLLLVGAEMEPEILTLLADTSIEKGKSIDLFKDSFMQGIKRLEDEVVSKWRLEAGETAIPVDVEGADLLYVALAGAHSIIPAAAIFNAAKENWTLSFFEAVNFGAFVGDPTKTRLIMERIVNEAIRLKVKEVVICECGTAFRVMKQMAGKQPFKISSITEVHARYIREGRIKLDKTKLDGGVTYHDPCYLGRHNSLYDDPRDAIDTIPGLKRIEMEGNCRDRSFCCGGGGLMLFYEPEEEQRMGVLRVEMAQKAGADVIVTACPFCLVNIEDAIKVAGLEGELEAIDLCELVLEHTVFE